MSNSRPYTRANSAAAMAITFVAAQRYQHGAKQRDQEGVCQSLRRLAGSRQAAGPPGCMVSCGAAIVKWQP